MGDLFWYTTCSRMVKPKKPRRSSSIWIWFNDDIFYNLIAGTQAISTYIFHLFQTIGLWGTATWESLHKRCEKPLVAPNSPVTVAVAGWVGETYLHVQSLLQFLRCTCLFAQIYTKLSIRKCQPIKKTNPQHFSSMVPLQVLEWCVARVTAPRSMESSNILLRTCLTGIWENTFLHQILHNLKGMGVPKKLLETNWDATLIFFGTILGVSGRWNWICCRILAHRWYPKTHRFIFQHCSR